MIEQLDNGHWHPIAYGSRSLGPSEKNYASIERETLSILFGCTHFHEFLYGRTFTIKNDHQPLHTIFSKSIIDCPPRIQRFFLALQKYDFTLEYEKGKHMVVSDALSRASINKITPEISEQDLAYHIHCIVSNLPISDKRLAQMQLETEKDVTLRKVKGYVLNGWPDKQTIDCDVSPYYQFKNEIVYNYNVLIKGQQILVPLSLREEVKNLIHQGHLGIEYCKRRYRKSVFWPGINHEISNLVNNCEECLTYRNRQQKETLIEQVKPEGPWLKVATDLFTIYGKNYLMVFDYYSNYFEISSLNDPIDSPEVIRSLKRIFSRHGIPKVVFSDNGPQYTATEFKGFNKQWDFSHMFSSPFFPQSNGLVERTIQTVKRTMKKAHDANQDIYLALLALNTTPGKDDVSHAEKLFNRQPRTLLPSVNVSKPYIKHFEKQGNVKEAFDMHAKDLPNLNPGDLVRIRTDKEKDWREQGKIVSKCSEPRSYKVLNSKGNIVRRNRKHLMHTNERFRYVIDYDKLLSDDDNTINHPPRVEPIPPNEQELHINDHIPSDSDNTSESVNHSQEPPRSNTNNQNVIVNDEPIILQPVQSNGRGTRSGRQSKMPSKYSDYEMRYR